MLYVFTKPIREKTNTKTELEPTGTFEHNHSYSYPRYRNMRVKHINLEGATSPSQIRGQSR
jgi:hypothetical protein